MVSAGDALPHRAHEEDRPLHARTPRTDPQLFPRSEAALQGSCRGPEQQSQTHHEKILRIPHLPLSRTCPLSLTWQITGAGINPRVFLTNQKLRARAGQGFNKARSDCITHQSTSSFHSEFSHYCFPVELDRLQRNVERCCNFLAGPILGDEANNLLLTLCQGTGCHIYLLEGP